MIPYINWTTIELGPITLRVWGMFVALGFLVGAYMAGRMAKSHGDDPKIIYDLTFWLMLAGLIGGRLGHVLLYDPAPFIADPWSVLKIWEGGLSVYGGFIACAIVGLVYLRKHQVDVHRYTDYCLFGLPFGYAIGRIGCFLIHDHPGTATSFILGVKYPDGTVRHDLGLYLSLQAGVLALIFLWISRKPRPEGAYIAGFCVWYGVMRFFLDYLRLIDVRYWGLTPGQYLSLALIGVGLWQFSKIRNKLKL